MVGKLNLSHSFFERLVIEPQTCAATEKAGDVKA